MIGLAPAPNVAFLDLDEIPDLHIFFEPRTGRSRA